MFMSDVLEDFARLRKVKNTLNGIGTFCDARLLMSHDRPFVMRCNCKNIEVEFSQSKNDGCNRDHLAEGVQGTNTEL